MFIPRYDDVDEALRTRIEKTGDCLVWTGAKSVDGYGRIRYRGEARSVHRVAWERRYGSEPEGLELDHLCRNRACINVAHLEPVTHAENMRRTRQAVLVERQCEWLGDGR